MIGLGLGRVRTASALPHGRLIGCRMAAGMPGVDARCMRNELNGQGAGGEHGMDTHAALMAQMGASKFCAILPGATQSSVQLTEAVITGAPCLQSQHDAGAWTVASAHLGTHMECQ